MALRIEDGDWIPLFRKIRKHWVWEDPQALRAWIDIIMMANHRESGFRFRGRIHPIARGQVATTLLSLAKRNGWSRNRVRVFLEALVNDKMVTTDWRTFDAELDRWTDSKTDRGFLLLTLVNYPVTSEDLEKQTAESPENGQQTDSRRTADGHIQEYKNNNNNKKEDVPEALPSAITDREERDPLLLHPNHPRGRGLLLLLGIPEATASALAAEHPVGRILDVQARATSQKNPGGWARRALTAGWDVPRAPQDAEDRLLQELKNTRSVGGPLFRSILKKPMLQRLEDESDDDFLRRVTEAKKTRTQ